MSAEEHSTPQDFHPLQPRRGDAHHLDALFTDEDPAAADEDPAAAGWRVARALRVAGLRVCDALSAAEARIAELEAALKEARPDEGRAWQRVPNAVLVGLRSAIKLAGELPPDAPTDPGFTVGRATSTINVLRGRIERTANRLRAQAAALAAGKE